MGRSGSGGSAADPEQQSEGQFVADPTAGDAEAMTGFLLRSDVVAGWPGLLVDAFDATGRHSIDCGSTACRPA